MSGDRNDLVTLVTEALLLADIIGKAVIEVRELEGVITLKGTVLSLEAKVFAETIAQEQDGVVKVVNQLVVSVHPDVDRFF